MKYYYGNSYKEAVANNPVEISTAKQLECYKAAYNVVIPADEDEKDHFAIVFKYKNDTVENVEEYDDADDARADFKYMSEDDRDSYQYAVLQKITYDCGVEDIEVVESFGLDENPEPEKVKYYWNGYMHKYLIGRYIHPTNENEHVVLLDANGGVIATIKNDFGAENMTEEELWNYLYQNLEEIEKVGEGDESGSPDQAKKVWKIPVTWEVCGTVEIEAETPEKALEIFKATEDEISLPTENDYVDGSFKLSDKNEESLIEMIKIFSK